MKPGRILFFLLSVLVILLVVSAVFPENGIRISEDLSLKFIRLDEIFREDTLEYADISDIIDNADPDPEISDHDTLNAPPIALQFDTVRANADSLRQITHLIEFPTGSRQIYYDFFERIRTLSSSRELVRILHYGDSQIETDRITSYVRYRLQKTFGGSGPGMVSAVPVFNGSMSLKQDYSSNWERFTAYGKIDSTIMHRRYGPLFSFSAYRQSIQENETDAWLLYQPSDIAFSTSRNFTRIRLLTGKAPGILGINIKEGDSLLFSEKLEPPEGAHFITKELEETPSELRFLFSGDGYPQVYCATFDGEWGLAVDNIPLRGSAGLEFSRSDTVFLRNCWEQLNAGMIILQFGGNVVPYMTNFQRYERYFKRELNIIKRMMPGIPVLVVGPSDMSVKEGGKYKTNPNLIKSRNALRNATLDSGYAFWDMYEAMGGKNSMPSWVFAEPPLAVSDFVHFNARGARIIGEMLYNALIYEYKLWESNQ